MTNEMIADGVAYVALGLNLWSMSMKAEYRLRLIATVANALYIVYGIFLGAYPIIIGCSIAVFFTLVSTDGLKTSTQ